MKNLIILCLFVVYIVFLKISECSNLNEKLALLLKRNDLLCPDDCLFTAEHPYFEDAMECCVCLAKPFWIVNSSSIVNLNISFLNENTPIISSKGESAVDQCAITYQYGNFTTLPEDLCNISNLVYVDFSYNYISGLDIISCLMTLDTLIIKGNRVTYLKTNVFSGMHFLRVVDLSYNILQIIEPGIFLNVDERLLHFDVSNNLLENIDISNIFRNKQDYFCVANFSFNAINRLTNVMRWSCNKDVDLGHGGYVDFENNNFTYIFNFAELGFSDATLLGKLNFYSFDFRFNLWFCDCRFFPMAKKADISHHILGSPHHGVKCHSPPEYKNKVIGEFILEQDLLICNISLAEKCPPHCRCFYQPSKNRTVINCRSSLVSHKLPLMLPDYGNLVLDFSFNNISELLVEFQRLLSEKRPYLWRTKEINFASNEIHDVPNVIFVALENLTKITFTNNPILRVPVALKRLRPCNVLFGTIRMKCTCSDIWLQQWLPSFGDCYNNTRVLCHTSAGLKSILDIDKSILGCATGDGVIKWLTFVLGICLFCIMISTYIIYTFRIEMYILYREHFQRNSSLPSYDYEVYIACNEQDDGLRKWITYTVLPYFEGNGHSVFLPYRDCQPGTPREGEIRETMAKSRNILIILSEVYDEITKRWYECELKYSWQNYRSDSSKNIVIINYDFLKTKNVSEEFIKAFSRLGKCIDFSNFRNDIKTKISSLVKYQKTSRTNIIREV